MSRRKDKGKRSASADAAAAIADAQQGGCWFESVSSDASFGPQQM